MYRAFTIEYNDNQGYSIDQYDFIDEPIGLPYIYKNREVYLITKKNGRIEPYIKYEYPDRLSDKFYRAVTGRPKDIGIIYSYIKTLWEKLNVVIYVAVFFVSIFLIWIFFS